MCGGVRGVGVGGIISSAFCILYRLFVVRLTRKQVYGLLNHGDSPYIRGIGFLYVRYVFIKRFAYLFCCKEFCFLNSLDFFIFIYL